MSIEWIDCSLERLQVRSQFKITHLKNSKDMNQCSGSEDGFQGRDQSQYHQNIFGKGAPGTLFSFWLGDSTDGGAFIQ